MERAVKDGDGTVSMDKLAILWIEKEKEPLINCCTVYCYIEVDFLTRWKDPFFHPMKLLALWVLSAWDILFSFKYSKAQVFGRINYRRPVKCEMIFTNQGVIGPR